MVSSVIWSSDQLWGHAQWFNSCCILYLIELITHRQQFNFSDNKVFFSALLFRLHFKNISLLESLLTVSKYFQSISNCVLNNFSNSHIISLILYTSTTIVINNDALCISIYIYIYTCIRISL
jgi:hypothetical protein